MTARDRMPLIVNCAPLKVGIVPAEGAEYTPPKLPLSVTELTFEDPATGDPAGENVNWD